MLVLVTAAGITANVSHSQRSGDRHLPEVSVLDQGSSNCSAPGNGVQILLHAGFDSVGLRGACSAAILTRSQVMPVLLVWGPHLEIISL